MKILPSLAMKKAHCSLNQNKRILHEQKSYIKIKNVLFDMIFCYFQVESI